MKQKGNVLVTILLVLAVLAGLGYYYFYRADQAVAPTPTPDAASTGTYNNAEHGFTFNYDRSLNLYLAKNRDAVAALGVIPPCEPDYIVCVAYAKDAFGKSNFESAGFSVRTIDEPDEASCQTADDENNFTTPGFVTVNGTKYLYFTSGGAAAGHSAGDYLYRAFRNGKCYELGVRIATTTYENYPEGTVSRFTDIQEEMALEKLSGIISTFKFK